GLPLVEGGHGSGVAVPDRQRDGHRVADRPSEAQDDRPEDPRTGGPQDRDAGRLPAGGAEAQRGLSLIVRDREEGLPRHRGDGWDDHDREDDARGELVRPDGISLEDGQETEDALDHRLDRDPHDRAEDEDPPQSVHDGRHRGEQFDDVCQRNSQPRRRKLGEEDRDAQADRDSEQEGERGGHQRPVHERDRPEDQRRDGVPDVAGQEPEAERSDGILRRQGENDRNQDEESDYAQPDGGRKPLKQRVSQGVGRNGLAGAPGSSERVHYRRSIANHFSAMKR